MDNREIMDKTMEWYTSQERVSPAKSNYVNGHYALATNAYALGAVIFDENTGEIYVVSQGVSPLLRRDDPSKTRVFKLSQKAIDKLSNPPSDTPFKYPPRGVLVDLGNTGFYREGVIRGLDMEKPDPTFSEEITGDKAKELIDIFSEAFPEAQPEV